MDQETITLVAKEVLGKSGAEAKALCSHTSTIHG